MKTYQIECGRMQGFYTAESIEQAFQDMMRINDWTQEDWGKLARFREVTINKGFEITKKSTWYYQDPEYLVFDRQGTEEVGE